ncbi:hypothetical protein LZ31DRAFT_310367 [Colletotrichum somersetense]|nr:hypothetical protein LZ31DRAFT_310367 [Colletotrichum somersetense]
MVGPTDTSSSTTLFATRRSSHKRDPHHRKTPKRCRDHGPIRLPQANQKPGINGFGGAAKLVSTLVLTSPSGLRGPLTGGFAPINTAFAYRRKPPSIPHREIDSRVPGA